MKFVEAIGAPLIIVIQEINHWINADNSHQTSSAGKGALNGQFYFYRSEITLVLVKNLFDVADTCIRKLYNGAPLRKFRSISTATSFQASKGKKLNGYRRLRLL